MTTVVVVAARGDCHGETASLGSLDHSGTWWFWSCWDQAEEGRLKGKAQKWVFCLVAAEVSREKASEEDKASHSVS